MTTRWLKVLLVAAIALDCSIAVFDNLTDYWSNYYFVQHVLSMDTIFPGNKAMWRAITHPVWHHMAYAIIIVIEFLAAVFCWGGAIRLCKTIQDPTRFHKAKKSAIIGLAIGLGLWLVGFMTIGGGWFLMWQSKEWNGQEAAFRLAAITGIVLAYLSLPDTTNDA